MDMTICGIVIILVEHIYHSYKFVTFSASRRNWELVNSGHSYMHNRRWQKQAEETKGYVDFTVASYNVLSQDLLESNPHLYTHCRKMPNVLEWDYRWHHLLREFTDLNADVSIKDY